MRAADAAGMPKFHYPYKNLGQMLEKNGRAADAQPLFATCPAPPPILSPYPLPCDATPPPSPPLHPRCYSHVTPLLTSPNRPSNR